ncbi:hypothetical protein GOODEAATRI_032479 [Goodea atripinnis]|uniref:Uncharacterized protein n=1 Tax=Goodea atripinnis TaxID=208336 RepID=A0ABV0PIW6_9TELE
MLRVATTTKGGSTRCQQQFFFPVTVDGGFLITRQHILTRNMSNMSLSRCANCQWSRNAAEPNPEGYFSLWEPSKSVHSPPVKCIFEGGGSLSFLHAVPGGF